MRFAGKVALVTGASTGIGRALALELARQGADVVAAARRLELLEKLCRDIEGLGRKALALKCDVTREDELRAAVAAATSRFGALDIVVANAGFGVVGAVEDLSGDDFRRQFETNVFGVIHTVKAALPELVKSKGRLALVGSVSGHVTVPGTAAYSMSKYAIRSLADALFHELRPKGVAVTLISPGFVESDFRQVDNQGVHHPESRDPYPQWLVMPKEVAARKIARAIAWRRREIILTGHGKLAVFIHRHFPWAMSLFFRWSGYKGRREPGTPV
ncbi:MAG TPA: SDR family oxidoreductase [Planctomycetota bacterium]|jgi:NAD(P)-dependent dehydrogenase (short-subunit alcohol dehydrogenase family)|nr:SDR family oxidoreductase [Planctomycetota bacterium]